MTICSLTLPVLSAVAITASSFGATTIYEADFSTAGQGSTHDSGSDGFETSPLSGANWVLTFGSLGTDSTPNEFITVGGLMRVQDWGGDGTITSESISIIGNGTIDISGTAAAIASGDAFNSSGEGLTWFYTLNGDTTTSGLLGNGTAVDGTDLSHVFSSVAVSNGDTLLVGFTIDVDGASDGAEISALTVDFTAVPEPSTTLLGGLALLGLLIRRR